MYEELDRASTVGSLELVLANIIMIEFEKIIVDRLIEYGIIKVYVRCVNDNSLVIKRQIFHLT